MSDFAARVDAFLAEFFALHPLTATTAGMHDHDAEWPDVTEAGRMRRLEFYDRWLTELAEYRFGETELREETWNPIAWVYMLGDGLFTLIAREFAPLETRLTSITGRIEAIPAVLGAAREALGSGERPVAQFHTEKALGNWS